MEQAGAVVDALGEAHHRQIEAVAGLDLEDAAGVAAGHHPLGPLLFHPLAVLLKHPLTIAAHRFHHLHPIAAGEEALGRLQGIGVKPRGILPVELIHVEHGEAEAVDLRLAGRVAGHPGHVVDPGPLAIAAPHVQLAAQQGRAHPGRLQPSGGFIEEGSSDAHGAAGVEAEAGAVAVGEAGELAIDLAGDEALVGGGQALLGCLEVEGAHRFAEIAAPAAGLSQPLRIHQGFGTAAAVWAEQGLQRRGVHQGMIPAGGWGGCRVSGGRFRPCGVGGRCGFGCCLWQ